MAMILALCLSGIVGYCALAVDSTVPSTAIPSRTAELQKIENTFFSTYNFKLNDQGVELVNSYIKHHPTSSFAHYLKGLGAHCKAYSMFGNYQNSFKMAGQLQDAIASYDDAYRLGLRSSMLFYRRGESQMVLHMAQQTEKNAKKRVSRDPRKDWVWAARGMIYASIGDDSKESRCDILVRRAITDLNQAIKLEPTYGPSWGARGMAYGAQGDFRRGLNDTRKGIELSPTLPTLYYEYAVINMQIRAYGAARKALDKALSLEPDHPVYRLMRAQAALAMFDSKAAESDISAVLAKEPNNAAALTLQSVIAIKQSQPEQAMADLLAADEINRAVASPGSGRDAISASTARKMLSKAALQYRALNASKTQSLYETGMLEWGLRHWSASISRFETLLARSKTIAATEMHSAALCALAQYSRGKAKEAGALLDKYSRLAQGRGFAGTVVRYLAGQIDESQLDALCKSTQDRTLANFYSGAKLARQGKTAQAKERLIWVRDKGDQHMDQYLLAIMELEQLGGEP